MNKIIQANTALREGGAHFSTSFIEWLANNWILLTVLVLAIATIVTLAIFVSIRSRQKRIALQMAIRLEGEQMKVCCKEAEEKAKALKERMEVSCKKEQARDVIHKAAQELRHAKELLCVHERQPANTVVQSKAIDQFSRVDSILQKAENLVDDFIALKKSQSMSE